MNAWLQNTIIAPSTGSSIETPKKDEHKNEEILSDKEKVVEQDIIVEPSFPKPIIEEKVAKKDIIEEPPIVQKTAYKVENNVPENQKSP